jgi:hypothetical protein
MQLCFGVYIYTTLNPSSTVTVEVGRSQGTRCQVQELEILGAKVTGARTEPSTIKGGDLVS